MFQVNQVMLVGNLTKDPVVRTFESGDQVSNFTVAVSERWKDAQSGEWKEKVDFVPVAAFRNYAKQAAGLVKGSPVTVIGKFRTRKWQKDGQDQYTTECVVDGLAGLVQPGSKTNGASASQDRGGYDAPPQGSSNGAGKSNGGGFQKTLDDEIPF